jgi:steroid delta-isomerase
VSLEEKIASSVNTYLESFEKKDLEAIIDLFADDCWIEDPVGTDRKIGKDALREFYQLGIDIGAKGTLTSEVRIVGTEAAFAFTMDIDAENGVFLPGQLIL